MKFHGIIPPLITPLHADGRLDFDGAARLVEHVIKGGVHGLFVLGTTGEGASLSHRQRRDFLDFVARQVAGRIPLVVNISDTACEDALDLADHARRAGARAGAFTPPYYFAPGAPELKDFVQHMSKRLSLPFFLYNMPGLTKVCISPELARFAFTLPNCLGIKDSSGDLTYFKKLSRVIDGRENLTLLIGPEELLLESLLAGGNGGINGGANVFPKLYVRIHALAQQGKLTQAVELQREALEVSCRLYTIGKHGSSMIKGAKAALEVRGICQRHLAAPFFGFLPDDFEKIKQALADLEARPALKGLLD